MPQTVGMLFSLILPYVTLLQLSPELKRHNKIAWKALLYFNREQISSLLRNKE